LGKVECALGDARQILRPVHSVNALAEWTVHLELTGIHVQVDFLLWMAPRQSLPWGWSPRGIRYSSCRIGQTRAEMSEQNAQLSRSPRITIRGMRRHLLMPRGNETDPALA
jgi:hypothetical protein